MSARDIQHGPYKPPHVAIGQIVRCAIRGRVRVHRWSDRGSIMWPLGIRSGPSPGRPAMILTGDLERAVRVESAIAVARQWGTTWRTVRVWRRALGVDRVTPGTRNLLAEGGNMSLRPYARAGNRASLQPESRRRRDQTHAATMRAKPGIQQHMQALAKIPPHA